MWRRAQLHARAGVMKSATNLRPTGGYYTHYIDTSAPVATDNGTACGTIDTPILTIPTAISKGSAVEVYDGPYASEYCLWAFGNNAAQPSFLRWSGKR